MKFDNALHWLIRVRPATRLDRWKSTKIIKRYYRTDTENACGDDTDAVRSAWSAGIACGDEDRSRQVGAVQIHAFLDDR